MHCQILDILQSSAISANKQLHNHGGHLLRNMLFLGSLHWPCNAARHHDSSCLARNKRDLCMDSVMVAEIMMSKRGFAGFIIACFLKLP